MIRWAPWEVEVRSRFAARERARGFWVALWVAVGAGELLVLRPILLARDTPIVGLDVVFGLVGGSFAAFGIVAWRRRPDSRSGLLMTGVGFAFVTSALLGQLTFPLAMTVRILLVDVWIFFFVALLLTLLTSGRLQSRFDRWLVAAYAIPLGILQISWLLFAEEEEGNLLVAFPDADVAHAIDRTQRGLLAGLCALTVVVIVARWAKTSGPRRRALLPSLAGALGLLYFTALLLNDILSGARSDVLLWLAACSLVTVPAAFLAGLLRSRLARGGLAELFRGLGAIRSADLQAALARALGDPGLVVAYWLPDYEAYADADGRPVVLPGPGGERAVAPVRRDGREVAALVYDASLDDDPELVEAVSAAAAMAIENAHLHAEAQARLAELRASRERIVAAGDAERRRLERNLHDGAQQRLVAISLQLRLLKSRIDGDASAERLVTSASGGARPVAGGAARARPWPPPRGARARPAGGLELARHPRDGRHLGVGGDVRAPARAGRAGGVLRRLRGAGEHRQVRARDPCHRQGLARRVARRDRDRRRRDRRRRRHARHRAARPRRPRRGARRPAPRLQPARRRDHRHRGAPVRVVIADDNLLVRAGIAALLREAGIEVAGEAATGEELLREVDAHEPDVAIVDIRMPPTHTDEGLRAAQEIRARRPGTAIVVLSQHVEFGVATRVLAEHPERLGYLLKDRVTDVDDFVGTLRRVAAGGTALDPQVVGRMLADERDDGPLGTLTPREREVLQALSEGLSNPAIAERMEITLRSAEKHVSSIFAKLDLPDTGSENRRVLAVLRFLS